MPPAPVTADDRIALARARSTPWVADRQRQGEALVVLTLGLGLAFFGGVEQMDRSAKSFPLQHCVDAIQDDKVAQTQMNKPQAATAATASAAPARAV